MFDAKVNARSILDALATYFLAQPIVFSVIVVGAFRLRPHIDGDGNKLVLFQRRLDGKKFSTVFAIDGDGNIWTAGTVNASTDFDVKKWNPA